MSVGRFQPSSRTIAGVALALFAFALVGVGLHHIILGGTCSSTGYSRYGPVPKCPEGTGWWVAFLIGGILLGIGGAILAQTPNLVIPVLFTAIGLGAITIALDNPDEKGAVGFGLVFGGCFLIGGLIGPVIALVRSRRKRRDPMPSDAGPFRPPSPPATKAIAAAVAWVAALGGAALLATVVAGSIHDDQTTAKHQAATVVQSAHDVGAGAEAGTEGRLGKEPPRPRHANAVAPTSPRSLFRARNLAIALSSARGELGTNADLSAFDLYPGEADLIVVRDGARRLVRINGDGDLTEGAPQDFTGQLQVVYLWQIRAGVPQRLASRIAHQGGVPTRRLDRMVVDVTQHGDTAGWVIYPRASPTRFLALLTGANLLEEGPEGTRHL